MLDGGYEIRFTLGTALLILAWMAAPALVGVAVWLHDPWLAAVGLFCSQVGVTLALIRDNNKTRRVIRAVVHDGLWPPARDIRGVR